MLSGDGSRALARLLDVRRSGRPSSGSSRTGGGSPPPPGTTGLYHVAVRYTTRAALADAVRRVLDAGIALDGASDHGVSEAVYLRDPDGNGLELYRDRPREEWPRPADGAGVAMFTRPLDLRSLLAEN